MNEAMREWVARVTIRSTSSALPQALRRILKWYAISNA